MPAPATTDELIDLILRSGLLAAESLAPYRKSGLTEPKPLLARMLHDRIVTTLQAKHLAAGRSRGFFLGEKYKLLEHLGTGGMGHVYLCEHLLLQRLVAVKILQANALAESGGAIARFFREARAVAALDHPNIVRVFDMDRNDSNPFMVMEYVDGTNLHAIVARGGPLPIERAANFARQAALGLQHAHQAGLVHRDIKPGNLLLERTGTVKLLDLGLARFSLNTERNKHVTSVFDAGHIVGTLEFIAPEQTEDSAVDIRADIYSLGCTLYFFLAGRAPFENGNAVQKVQWHQKKSPPPLSDFREGVPEALNAVIRKMLAKSPDDRYSTPADVAAALAPWGEKPVPPPTAAEMPKIPASAFRLGLTPARSLALTLTPRPTPAQRLPAPVEQDATADAPTYGSGQSKPDRSKTLVDLDRTKEIPPLPQRTASLSAWTILLVLGFLVLGAVAGWLLFFRPDHR